MAQLAAMLKKELNRILQDKSSTVIDLGDKRVIITTIETNTQYDLDNDLDDPEIADAVAKGYEDYKAGRIVEHGEVIRELGRKYEDD
jgi:hypothetical protein